MEPEDYYIVYNSSSLIPLSSRITLVHEARSISEDPF